MLLQIMKTVFVNSIDWLQSFLIKIQAPSKHQNSSESNKNCQQTLEFIV